MMRMVLILVMSAAFGIGNAYADGAVCSQILIGGGPHNLGVALPVGTTSKNSRRLQTRFDVPDDKWLDCPLDGVCPARLSIGAALENHIHDTQDGRDVWYILVGNNSINSWVRYCVAYSGTPQAQPMDNFVDKPQASTGPSAKDGLPTSKAAKELMSKLHAPKASKKK